jgi:hypothetical protein
MLASRKTRTVGAGRRLQHLCQLRFGCVELPLAFRRVHLDRQRDRRPKQQPLGRHLRDQLVVGLQAQRLAELRRQRDHAPAGDGDGGTHRCSFAEKLQIGNLWATVIRHSTTLPR